MKVNIRKPKLLIHIPMHFKKTIQFKTVKVNIKETTGSQREPVIASNTRRCHAISRGAYMLLQELLVYLIQKMQREGQ